MGPRIGDGVACSRFLAALGKAGKAGCESIPPLAPGHAPRGTQWWAGSAKQPAYPVATGPRAHARLPERNPLSGPVGKSYAQKWSLAFALRGFVLNFCARNPVLNGASCCFSRTFKKSVKTYCGFKSWPLEFVEISVLTTTCCG